MLNYTRNGRKAYDETIRRGPYRSIKAEHLMVDDDDDDESSGMFTPYSFVKIYQRFEGLLCLHLHCQEVQELPYLPSKRRSIFPSQYGL